MNTQEIRKNPEIAIWLPESARGIYKQHIIKRETKSRLYKDQPSNLKKVFNKMHADYELLMKKINLQVIKHGRNKSTPGKIPIVNKRILALILQIILIRSL